MCPYIFPSPCTPPAALLGGAPEMPPISSCLCPSLEVSLLPVLQGNTHRHKSNNSQCLLYLPKGNRPHPHHCLALCSILRIAWFRLWPIKLPTAGCNPQIWHFLGASGKEPTCQCRRHKRFGFDPWVGKIPCRKKWQHTPVFLPGESHGQRKPGGYSPKGRKESKTTEVT